MISPSHIDARGKPRGHCRRLALAGPRHLRGVTRPELVCNYHESRKNLSEYTRRNIAGRMPEPTTEELVAWLHDAIESFSEGIGQAPWEIHCAVTLIKSWKGVRFENIDDETADIVAKLGAALSDGPDHPETFAAECVETWIGQIKSGGAMELEVTARCFDTLEEAQAATKAAEEMDGRSYDVSYFERPTE